MIQLRNNQTTEDVRLDRLIQFDEKSRDFPIRSLVGEKPLRSYTWAVSKVLDQGREGSCTGMAVAHELLARPVRVQGLDERFAKETIYWEAQKIDPWDGGSYPGASPFYEGSSVLAAVKVAQKLGYFESYHWSFTFRDALLGIGYGGGGIMGAYWTEDMYSPDKDGFIKPTGRRVGGHAFYVNKVSLKGGYVGAANSWGRGYGKDGFMKIRFDDFEKMLMDNGEMVFPVKRKFPKKS